MAGQHAQGHDTRRAILRALLLRKSTPNPGNERPERPFTGYKLAHAVLSADGTKAGFAGLTLGGDQVYGVTADATCVWTPRHAPPRRWCGCGFYCLHEISDARGLGCATENRSALLLEVVASGRYIRYERGLRYSRQRVKVIRDAWCACGRPGVVLGDAGSGLIGWRHLAPFCSRCAVGRPSLTLREFAAKLDGRVEIDQPTTGAGLSPLLRYPEDDDLIPGLIQHPPESFAPLGADAPSAADSPSDAGSLSGPEETPIAVLMAEIALLHARLDDLQSRMDR